MDEDVFQPGNGGVEGYTATSVFPDPDQETQSDPFAPSTSLPADPVPPELPAVTDVAPPDYRVTLAGREFTVEEPDLECLMGMLKLVGRLGMRAEGYVGATLSGMFRSMVNGKAQTSVPPEATLFALLSILETADIIKIAVLALFGGSKQQEQEGLTWFKEIGIKNIKLNPIVTAVRYRIELSSDLREALGNLAPVSGIAGALTAGRKTTPTA